MTNKMMAVAATSVLLTLAGSAFAKTTAKKDPRPTGMDKLFAVKAAQGGIFEVQSSQIALNKTHNNQVRMVARRMVKEHSAANNELKTVAQDKRMTLPTETDPKHRAVVARLRRLSGTAFDKAYMASQESAHAATVKLFENEIATGQDKDVTAFASKNLPTIEDHTRMIFQVGSNLGVHSTTMPKLKPAMMPSSMSGKNM
jgi:putative membrane protein